MVSRQTDAKWLAVAGGASPSAGPSTALAGLGAYGAQVALALGLFSVCQLAACQHKVDERIVDSEGRAWSLKCSGPECFVKRQEAPPVSPDKSEAILSSVGRIIGVCDVAPADEHPPPYDCRPITCASNAACPPALGLEAGVCVNGHCIEPSHDVTVEDAVMLCLAGTGTGRDTPKQAELYVLAFNCGSPCQVPRVCEQP